MLVEGDFTWMGPLTRVCGWRDHHGHAVAPRVFKTSIFQVHACMLGVEQALSG